MGTHHVQLVHNEHGQQAHVLPLQQAQHQCVGLLYGAHDNPRRLPVKLLVAPLVAIQAQDLPAVRRNTRIYSSVQLPNSQESEKPLRSS